MNYEYDNNDRNYDYIIILLYIGINNFFFFFIVLINFIINLLGKQGIKVIFCFVA